MKNQNNIDNFQNIFLSTDLISLCIAAKIRLCKSVFD